jgi:YidC/Oxa1 family membrane protein insertase
METLRNIFDPLFNLLGATLTTFHGWGAPWWLAIIMLTAVVRTFLFPLTVRQVKSMRRMQELKPDMDEIRDKYKDDPQKQQQEIMNLYGERKVNPLGGCLPLVVQLPIFIALYYTIKQFDKLESFANGGLFWFKDLTIRRTAPSRSILCASCPSPSASSSCASRRRSSSTGSLRTP